MSDFASLPFGKTDSRDGRKRFPLHAMTILSGHCVEGSTEYYNDGRTISGGNHVAFQYTVSGRGELELDGGTVPLSPGSLMVLTLPGPYAYYLPEGSPRWEFVFLTMIGREVIRIARVVEKRWGTVMPIGDRAGTLSCLRSFLESLRSGEIDSPYENSLLTYQFCMRFLEEQERNRAEVERPRFAPLDEFLKGNLRKDVSVSEMAEVMRLSRSYFTRIFTREMGVSPRQYFEDQRLSAASALLLEEGVTVKETAIRCGFPDVNYFCRLFRKRLGVSPGEYRSRELSGP